MSQIVSYLRTFTTKHYEEAPAPLQDLICTAYGFQELWRRRGTPADARARVRQIEALQWGGRLEPETVEDGLRRILDLARTVRGYRDRAPERAASAREELSRWPIVTKQDLYADHSAYLTRQPTSSDIVTKTSGTTGTPLEIWRAPVTTLELFRSIAQFRSWYGVSLDPRRASFTGKMVVPLQSDRVWRVNLSGKQLVLSQYHLSPEHAADYARVLKRWRPEVLDGYTSNLVDLARVLKGAGLKVHIPLVVTTCEVLSPSGRALLQEVFDCKVADQYGTSEHVALAGECPHGNRHIFENLGLIEAVDEQGHVVPDGTVGRLLLTTLTNELMPLVRYEVGDLGSLEHRRICPCGRTSPLLLTIEGRTDDTIRTRDGRSIAIFTFNVLRGFEGVLQMQIVQKSFEHFRVRVVLDRSKIPSNEPFEARVHERFERLLGTDPSRRLEFSYEDSIERTPGGKIRNVVREFAA